MRKIVCDECVRKITRAETLEELSSDEISTISECVAKWNGWLVTNHIYFLQPDKACFYYICPKCQKEIIKDNKLPSELYLGMRVCLNKQGRLF